MEGIGLRVASVVGCRWRDIDLTKGRIHVLVKGQHWQWRPIQAQVLEDLRACYATLQPDPDGHVWVTERELWESQHHRVRVSNDPKQPSSRKSLWAMVRRASERAGVVEPLKPHDLRRGFASRLGRRRVDLHTIQYLMGHSRPDTTKIYLEERVLEDAAEALEEAFENVSQASPSEATPAEWPTIPVMEAAGFEVPCYLFVFSIITTFIPTRAAGQCGTLRDILGVHEPRKASRFGVTSMPAPTMD